MREFAAFVLDLSTSQSTSRGLPQYRVIESCIRMHLRDLHRSDQTSWQVEKGRIFLVRS